MWYGFVVRLILQTVHNYLIVGVYCKQGDYEGIVNCFKGLNIINVLSLSVSLSLSLSLSLSHQILDLCTLDISSRQFSSSVLAASALYLISDKCQSHLNLITGMTSMGLVHNVNS